MLDPVGLAEVLIESQGGQSTFYLPGLAQYDNAWAYYLPDRLGNLRQLANNTGQVTLAQSYDPFGNVLERSGSGQSIFGYTGEQTDLTGLVFLRERYYNPAVGRFLTADSVIPNPLSSMGWNRYAYVKNNPIRYIDPSGQCFFGIVDSAVCIGLVVIGVGLLVSADAPLPPGEAPPPEQGLFALGLMGFGAGGEALTALFCSPAGITITEKGWNHTILSHTFNNLPQYVNKSKFWTEIDIRQLINQASNVPAIPQSNGNFARIVDAGRNIGIDRTTGLPTRIYTVITNAAGELVTAFPGRPTP